MDLQESLQDDDYGDSVKDALDFAMTKSGDTIARLEDIQQLSKFKKVFYGVYEVALIPLVAIWLGFVVSVWFSYEGFDGEKHGFLNDVYIKGGFVLLTIIANYHVALLGFVIIAAIPLFVIFALFYPFSILLFCTKLKSNPRNKVGILLP